MRLCCYCLKPLPTDAGLTMYPYLFCQCPESHATITVTLHSSTGTVICSDGYSTIGVPVSPSNLKRVPDAFYDAFTDEELRL